MRYIQIFTLVAVLATPLLAMPNELAERLAQLALDPLNDERFNEIDHMVDNQELLMHTLQNMNIPQLPHGDSDNDDEAEASGAIPTDPADPIDPTDPHPTDAVDTTNVEANKSEEAEIQPHQISPLISAMAGFLGRMIQRLLN